MNTKRQTIWLVSMLSLMVVLSAYYLFTQDIGPNDELTDATHLENAAQVANLEEGAVDSVSSDVGTTGEESSYEMSQLDHDMLAQLEADGYFNSDVFDELLTKREQQNLTEENRIMSDLADANGDSVAALADLEALEDKSERKAQLESVLLETYEMALVSEEVNDKYKVVVASDGLEKKEAAEIIEQVITVMEVRPEQVSVQFVPAP